MTITILDGGMSRELMRLNAPFRQPEWSALSLYENQAQFNRYTKILFKAAQKLLPQTAMQWCLFILAINALLPMERCLPI